MLYVEVAGTDVNPGHELVLEKDGAVVDTLAMTQKKHHQLHECSYDIDEVERFDHTLALNIKKAEGGAIRLPLLDEPRATRLKARTQPNLLVPIYPLAELPMYEGENNHALLRPGYLYVFWKGILWRELQNDENGKLSDVDLAEWREKARNGERSALDERAAVGSEIDTVWVPARFQDVVNAKWTIQDVEIAWSEEQWSWDYIESLESGHDMISMPRFYRELTGIPSYGKGLAEQPATERRNTRCVDLSGLKSYDYPKRFGPDSLAGNGWLPTHTLSPACKRDPERELYAANPFVVTSGLDGKGLGAESDGVLHRIRSELEQLEGYTCKINETVDFVKGFSNWVGETLEDIGQDTESDNKAGLFSEGAAEKAETARQDLLKSVNERLKDREPEPDILSTARQKHIAAVPVPDALFELGWLVQQSSLELNYLSALVESTQKHPHFKSAMLLNSALFDHLGNERGPFDEYRREVDSEKLDSALRKTDREASRERFYDLVEKRVRVLKSTDGVATFNDLFALNGLRYLIGQHTLNQCLVHLDTSVFNFDRLAGSAAKKTEAYRADHGSDFVKSLAKGDEGLSKFLVASLEDATSGSATSESAAEGKNDGSGHLRASLLQRLQTMSIDESEVPEALREHYAISRKQYGKVVENIPTLEDDTLTQWVQASYTSVGQLVAEVTSEFYEMTQRIVLQEMAKAPVYKHFDTILIPLELLRAGNPFMQGGLKLTHADEFMTNPNPEMVPLGIRFGGQESGVAKFSDSALNESLKKAGGQGLLSPKGGVPNRVGPGMEGNYAVIRDQQGRVLANSASVAGYGGDVPKGAVQAEIISAHQDSMAARYSQGIRNKAASAALRWAPPGMLGLFTWNAVAASSSLLKLRQEDGSAEVFKQGTAVIYSVVNFLYWLGHINEAAGEVRNARLEWLTKSRLEVEKIDNGRLKSVARFVFKDEWLSIARFAGVLGAALEVVLAAWQGVERLNANDNDAAAGYFTSAAGFFVFMFSHAAGMSVVPLLGVTFAFALGALSLVIALGALVWAIICTDDTLETWIKNGPFGKVEPADQFAHLMDSPDDAFNFLVGALFPIRGESRPVSHYEANGSLSEDEIEWIKAQSKNAAQVISVSSSAFILMDKPEEQFKARFWKYRYDLANNHKSIEPLYIYYDADNYMLRFYFDELEFGYVKKEYMREELKAKVQLMTSNGALLPVTDIEEPLQPAETNPSFGGASARWYTI